jgi:hypothetical protein
MHSSIKFKNITIRLSIILLFTFFILFIPSVLSAEGENLQIISVDEVNEGEFFTISVLDPEYSGNETPFLIDVNINFDGIDYQITIDDDGEKRLLAPEVDQDTIFTINASKNGYNSTSKTITVLNIPKLEIVPLDGWTVDADQKFSVKIIDDQGNPVTDANVAVDKFGVADQTDSEGIATLTAPNDRETISIIAQKDGYEESQRELEVNIIPPWWEQFVQSSYFPIIIAAIFLIIVIVFVSLKQKKSIYERTKEISKEKTFEKYDKQEKKEIPEEKDNAKEAVRTQPAEDAKVEEIRISRPRKEKEIVPVKSEEDETEKVINRKMNQRRDYDWFEGKEDVRYEIDKLTGEVDEEGLDKWYEGVDNLKEKIDEKVKKKDKKKEENEE